MMSNRNMSLNEKVMTTNPPESRTSAQLRTWRGLLIAIFVASFTYVTVGGNYDAKSALERLGGILDPSPMTDQTFSIAEAALGFRSVELGSREMSGPARLLNPAQGASAAALSR